MMNLWCLLLALAAGPRTGPEPGQPVPSFELEDHLGRKQTFDSLKGTNGLVLAFVRSADW